MPFVRNINIFHPPLYCVSSKLLDTVVGVGSGDAHVVRRVGHEFDDRTHSRQKLLVLAAHSPLDQRFFRATAVKVISFDEEITETVSFFS